MKGRWGILAAARARTPNKLRARVPDRERPGSTARADAPEWKRIIEKLDA